jgi:hypothetical protein
MGRPCPTGNQKSEIRRRIAGSKLEPAREAEIIEELAQLICRRGDQWKLIRWSRFGVSEWPMGTHRFRRAWL